MKKYVLFMLLFIGCISFIDAKAYKTCDESKDSSYYLDVDEHVELDFNKHFEMDMPDKVLLINTWAYDDIYPKCEILSKKVKCISGKNNVFVDVKNSRIVANNKGKAKIQLIYKVKFLKREFYIDGDEKIYVSPKKGTVKTIKQIVNIKVKESMQDVQKFNDIRILFQADSDKSKHYINIINDTGRPIILKKGVITLYQPYTVYERNIFGFIINEYHKCDKTTYRISKDIVVKPGQKKKIGPFKTKDPDGLSSIKAKVTILGKTQEIKIRQ